jgi:tripartite-type tricarboxylate transporter receptor subunit TctC
MRASRHLFIVPLLVLAMAPAADAQDYPTRPVRMIVPYQPGGGGLDAMARLLAQKLSERSGAKFYVENIPGAGGTIGTGTAAQAPADGHTILFMNQDFVVQALIKEKVPYDPFKSFGPVAMTAIGWEAIVVNPSLPVTSVKDLIALLKANPGKYSYATPGYGTSPHLASERLFKLSHGLDVVHLPFQGGAPAVAATIGGHANILHINLAVVAPYIRSGQLRPLAVAHASRAPAFPEIPTLDEGGIRNHEVGYWNGVLVPARTPGEIIDRLNRFITEALSLPDVKEKLATAGFQPIGSSPSEFAAHIAAESARWSRTVREAGIRVD